MLAGLLLSPVSFAVSETGETTYLSRDAFIAQAFEDETAEAKLLWLTGALREQATAILGHPPRSARLRYWQANQRRAWVLEDIGKERLITAGFVVENGVLRQVDVLIYRESRGWEIRNRVFTDQFRDARLEDEHQRLDRSIDNISGATLSVKTMQRLARLALALDQHLSQQ